MVLLSVESQTENYECVISADRHYTMTRYIHNDIASSTGGPQIYEPCNSEADNPYCNGSEDITVTVTAISPNYGCTTPSTGTTNCNYDESYELESATMKNKFVIGGYYNVIGINEGA